jgi:hypothetical protein
MCSLASCDVEYIEQINALIEIYKEYWYEREKTIDCQFWLIYWSVDNIKTIYPDDLTKDKKNNEVFLKRKLSKLNHLI